ncbi:MAG: hypothetical protein ACJ73N_05630 [Bryobacteraceae bacterium]
MKKNISELAKDPYAWGLLVCGWTSVYMGVPGVALVVATAYLTMKRTERIFNERLYNAVEKGVISVHEKES